MTSLMGDSLYQRALMQWQNLAQKRLDSLIELFESGRYRRYYSDEQIRNVLAEAQYSVVVWQALVAGDSKPAAVVGFRREPRDAVVDQTMTLIATHAGARRAVA